MNQVHIYKGKCYLWEELLKVIKQELCTKQPTGYHQTFVKQG